MSNRLTKDVVLTINSDGTIVEIEQNVSNIDSMPSVEFYNGVLIPGTVNCHCHIEYSYVKGMITRGSGLPEFIRSIIEIKCTDPTPLSAKTNMAKEWAQKMWNDGIVAVGDHNNNDYAYPSKTESPIHWHTFVELFDVDGQSADETYIDGLKRIEHHRTLGLKASMAPHACYTMEDRLMALCGGQEQAYCGARSEGVCSVHFKESVVMAGDKETERVAAALGTNRSSVLLVHGIYATEADIECMQTKLKDKITVVSCPLSNVYIEKTMADIDMLRRKGVRIALGTDGLSSNDTLSITEEIKFLQERYPNISLEEVLGWATLNGAKALEIDSWAGSIEVNKRPGIILLNGVDFDSMRTTSKTTATRLI